MKILTANQLRKGFPLIAFVLLYMTLRRLFQSNVSVKRSRTAYTNPLNLWTSLDHTNRSIDDTADLFRHAFHQISRALHYEQGGVDKEYLLVSNIVGPADDNVVEAPDTVNNKLDEAQIVTLSVHCTDNNLHYLHDLSVFWTGPISVAVFTYGRAVLSTVKYMLHLHLCYKRIQTRVTFHLAVPLKNGFPEDFVVNDRGTVHVDCIERKHSAVLNYNTTEVPYPSNVLRNFALNNVRTPYVLNADIDFLPSENLYNNLVKFLKSFNGSKHQTTDKLAFVLPAMETRLTLTKPLAKERLLRMWTKDQIRPFYLTVCWKCHLYTDFFRWVSLPKKYGINSGYEIPWRNPWEPFYISQTAGLPRFNEVFKRYGFNRISQLCEMHMAGYTFVVLDTGFLVHRGLKEHKTFHGHKLDENTYNLKKYKLFEKELIVRYGNTTRRCTDTKQFG